MGNHKVNARLCSRMYQIHRNFNYLSTIITSGVLAAWNVVNHLMHLQDYWRTWLKGLKWFMACGIVFMIISSAGFVTYLVFGITKHQGIVLL